MKTFGYSSEHLQRIATPIGSKCPSCNVHIRDGDRGVVVPHIETRRLQEHAWHLTCFLKSLGIDPP